MPVLGKLTDSHPHSELEVVKIDEDHAAGVAFNMVFVIWQRRTTALAYRHFRDLLLQVGRTHPEGVGTLQLLGRDVIPPDAAARREFVQFMRLEPVKHSSVVYEEKGFKAASIRAVVASAHALARPGFSHSVHSRLADAAKWHADAQAAIGRREAAAEIAQMATTLRARHEERYSR